MDNAAKMTSNRKYISIISQIFLAAKVSVMEPISSQCITLLVFINVFNTSYLTLVNLYLS
jgi:hypothetical protein